MPGTERLPGTEGPAPSDQSERKPMDVVEQWLADARVRRDVLIGLGLIMVGLTVSVGLHGAAGVGTALVTGMAGGVGALASTRAVVRRRNRRRQVGGRRPPT